MDKQSPGKRTVRRKIAKKTVKKRPRYKQNEHGLPVYPGWILPWTHVAAPPTLNQEAYRVFFLILRKAGGVHRGHDLLIPMQLIEAWGISERTYRSSLNRLSENGLIRIHRRPKQQPLIDLICLAPADSENPFRTERPIMDSVSQTYRPDVLRGHAPAPQYEQLDGEDQGLRKSDDGRR